MSDQRTEPERAAPRWWLAYVHVIEVLVGGLLISTVIVTFGNIIRRSLGFGVFTWADETARRMLIWMTFLGAVLAIVHASHLRIDAFLDWAPPKHARIIRIVIGALSIAFFLMLIIEGGIFANSSRGRTTPAMSVSALWTTAILPVGGLLMLFTFFGRIRFGPAPPLLGATREDDTAVDD